MKALILAVGVAWLVAVGCTFGDDATAMPSPTSPPQTAGPTVRTPTAEPTPSLSPEPDHSGCPVDNATCALAQPIIDAWRENDIGRLMALSMPLEVACPVPRPQGLGGPYPLCEDAAVDGEVRSGYLWSSGTHGGLWDEPRMRAGLSELLRLDLDLLTIGCRLSTSNSCDGDFVLVFGTTRFGNLDVVYDVPVFVDGGEGRLVGALPRMIYCTAPGQSSCERMAGGTMDGPDYRYWVGGDPPSRPLPEWTFFLWTP